MEFNFRYPDTHDTSTPPGGNDDALDAKFAEYNSKYAIVLTGACRPSGMPAARCLVCLAKHNNHAVLTCGDCCWFACPQGGKLL